MSRLPPFLIHTCFGDKRTKYGLMQNPLNYQRNAPLLAEPMKQQQLSKQERHKLEEIDVHSKVRPLYARVISEIITQ